MLFDEASRKQGNALHCPESAQGETTCCGDACYRMYSVIYVCLRVVSVILLACLLMDEFGSSGLRLSRAFELWLWWRIKVVEENGMDGMR